jgi:chromosome segregation ATPase
MPERIERLRATLAELETELHNLDALDPASRERLEEVSGEIDALLARRDLSSGEHHTLAEQLTESVEAFRVQHPTLSGVLQRLVDGLSQLGI